MRLIRRGAGSADAAGVGTPAAQVRASRAGGGDGRVYRIAFEARDLAGASCAGVVEVCVPHDRRPDAVCEDSGALVDSTRPWPGQCESRKEDHSILGVP